jgi:hypothetical protein
VAQPVVGLSCATGFGSENQNELSNQAAFRFLERLPEYDCPARQPKRCERSPAGQFLAGESKLVINFNLSLTENSFPLPKPVAHSEICAARNALLLLLQRHFGSWRRAKLNHIAGTLRGRWRGRYRCLRHCDRRLTITAPKNRRDENEKHCAENETLHELHIPVKSSNSDGRQKNWAFFADHSMILAKNAPPRWLNKRWTCRSRHHLPSIADKRRS